MLSKDKAETILAEIKQKIESGGTDSLAFSSQTIQWIAASLVEAIDEVEKIHGEKEAAIKKISAERDTLREEYFQLVQDFRKAETVGIAKKSKGKLLKKWRGE